MTSERLGTQRLIVVAEVRQSELDSGEGGALVRKIVADIHEARGLRPGRVLLVRPGTIPKTTSGKIQHARLASLVEGDALRDAVVYPTRGARRAASPEG